jgi:hypothetical protein
MRAKASLILVLALLEGCCAYARRWPREPSQTVESALRSGPTRSRASTPKAANWTLCYASSQIGKSFPKHHPQIVDNVQEGVRLAPVR